jgi:hypothetical protein
MLVSEPTRVRDKRTGNRYTVVHVDPEVHEVLDEPAVDANGFHLDPTGPEDEPAPEWDARAYYEALSRDDLRDAVKARNVGRDKDAQMPFGGNKGDLVSVLLNDDAAGAQTTPPTTESTPETEASDQTAAESTTDEGAPS